MKVLFTSFILLVGIASCAPNAPKDVEKDSKGVIDKVTVSTFSGMRDYNPHSSTASLPPSQDNNNLLFCGLFKQSPIPTDSVRYYLEAGLNPNCICETVYGEQKLASYFLVLRKLVGDPFHRKTVLETPLLMAILQKNLPLVDLLIQYGAHTNVHIGTTALPLNAALMIDSYEISLLLLSHGAEAVHADLGFAQSEKLIDYFLAAGASPETIDIELALKKGNIPLLRRLLKKGAQVESVDAFDLIRYHEYETLEVLLEGGMDPNIKCRRQGETLLGEAIRADKSDKLKLLLTWGADSTLIPSIP